MVRFEESCGFLNVVRIGPSITKSDINCLKMDYYRIIFVDTLRQYNSLSLTSSRVDAPSPPFPPITQPAFQTRPAPYVTPLSLCGCWSGCLPGCLLCLNVRPADSGQPLLLALLIQYIAADLKSCCCLS